MPTLRVLAGDIGGTKTLLQLAEFEAGELRPQQVLREQRFDSHAYQDLVPMLDAFLEESDLPLHGACFGVAGPVHSDDDGQTARLTNLPWHLDSRRLAADLGLPAVRLINDFQAVGYGIEALLPEESTLLHDRPARPGAPRVVLGAGTGLGVALLLPCQGRYEAFPTEGGHTDFSGNDLQQDRLLAFLRGEFGHVSWERLVSGPGLVNIYRFLLQRDGVAPEQDRCLQAADPAAAIAIASQREPRAEEALDLFCELFGAVAGNLALTTLAYGGVYLAGGIAPKLLHHLQRGGFARAYLDKGRMSDLVDTMPVRIVTHPNVGMLGALLAASRL